MPADLPSFSHLLKLFEGVPPSTRSRTFMEVAGYPHYENVCSNILAFYLDAAGEHEMGTLMLESLLDLTPAQDPPVDLEGVTIEREYTTPKNQRIDLVLEGSTHVIAIENKVYHWLANDLAHYSKTVEALAGPERKTIKFVLSPAPLPEDPGHGFRSITYRELWQKVQARIGNHLSTVHPKWLTFLIDFIETSDRFIPSEQMELNDSDRFIIEHQKDIDALVRERDQFLNKLTAQANRLQANLAERLEGIVESVWIYKKHSVVSEYLLCGHKIALDLTIHAEGWYMGFMGRNPEAQTFLQKALSTWPEAAGITIPHDHISVNNWPLETAIEQLSDTAHATLISLTEHAQTLTSTEIEAI